MHSLALLLLAIVLPMNLVDNRPIVTVTANGVPLHFIVDTGSGGNVLDANAAKRLGVGNTITGVTDGAGEGTMAQGTAKLHSFCVATFCERDVALDTLDLSTIAKKTGLGRVDGVLGSPFLSKHVVTFAYARGELVVDAAPPSEGVPFTFYGAIPKVRAKVDGVSGSFILDTGDRSSLTLFPHFATTNGFEPAKVAVANATTGWGVGGPVIADLFVAKTLAVGDAAARSVVSRISKAKKGGFSATDIDGSIGSGFMRAFDVTFSYATNRVGFRPVAKNWTDRCDVPAGVIPPEPCLLHV